MESGVGGCVGVDVRTSIRSGARSGGDSPSPKTPNATAAMRVPCEPAGSCSHRSSAAQVATDRTLVLAELATPLSTMATVHLEPSMLRNVRASPEQDATLNATTPTIATEAQRTCMSTHKHVWRTTCNVLPSLVLLEGSTRRVTRARLPP